MQSAEVLVLSKSSLVNASSELSYCLQRLCMSKVAPGKAVAWLCTNMGLNEQKFMSFQNLFSARDWNNGIVNLDPGGAG